MLHMKWSFSAIALAAAAATEGSAQQANPPPVQAPCATLACDIQSDWVRNNVMLYLVADAMPEDKYGFKPTPAQQTFGERVLHVASVNVDLLRTLGAKTSAPSLDLKAKSKADVIATLRQAGEYGTAVLREFNEQQLAERVRSPEFMGPMSSRERIVYFLITHSQDTYGQLVVYLRLNGIIPPLSRQP